jgi:hypothetical protein
MAIEFDGKKSVRGDVKSRQFGPMSDRWNASAALERNIWTSNYLGNTTLRQHEKNLDRDKSASDNITRLFSV